MNKNAIKVICFSAIFLLLFACANTIFKFKSEDGLKQVEHFYDEKENTIDVLFIGSSHIYSNVNPAVLWEEQGIAAYCLSSSAQAMWNSYHYLEEALKTQQPKVVVLDVLGLAMLQDYMEYPHVVRNTEGLKFSQNKINAVKASTAQQELWPDLLIGWPTYHSRYNELTKDDFSSFPWNDYANNKGFYAAWGSKSAAEPEEIANVSEGDILPKALEYFNNFLTLAKENEIPVLLIKTPYVLSDRDQTIYSRVEEIATEYGVPFINYNLLYEEISLDFAIDMHDNDHLSESGSYKLSSDLGKRLKATFEIPDRREDIAYASWDDCLDEWNHQELNYALQSTTDIYSFTQLAQNENYAVAMFMNQIPAASAPVAADALKSLGLQTDIAAIAANDYIAVIDGGNIVCEEYGPGPLSARIPIDSGTMNVLTSGISGTKTGIAINDENVSINGYGINIVVYDKYLGVIADSIACDIFNTDQLVRE